PDRGRLQRWLAAHPEARVSWRQGYTTDRKEIATFLAAADAYVLASRHEGFPVAPLEAITAGLPVVASLASGVRDIFPRGELDGAILVEPGDVDALAEGLRVLLIDPERRSRL